MKTLWTRLRTRTSGTEVTHRNLRTADLLGLQLGNRAIR